MAWEELVTLREAVSRTGISLDTLREARDRGELRVYQIGLRWQRVTWSELQAWLEAHAVPARNESTRAQAD